MRVAERDKLVHGRLMSVVHTYDDALMAWRIPAAPERGDRRGMIRPVLDGVDDLWPESAPPAAPLDQLVLASHLLGANRAVANYGGGNTSVKSEDGVLWVKGSGSDLATIGREQFTGLRLDAVLALFERDAMSDEEMVACLAGCQLDPAMPRCSIETLLHAFVPAAHVHHTHPDGINALAGTADGERLVRECFGGAAAWIPYIRPGFTLSKQVGEAVRADPGLELVVLAKHGLVVWGDTAEQAYRRTIDVINQAVAFVNERTRDVPRFGGPHPAARRARPERLHELANGWTVDTSARVVEFVSAVDAERLAGVGAPCPDHLVHTKRLPLWIPHDPDADSAHALRARIAERTERHRAGYRAYVERHGDETTNVADADPRIVLVQHLGLIAASEVARDLYHRAIEVMAGADALGRFVSLDEEESFAIEYWPLERYKLGPAAYAR